MHICFAFKLTFADLTEKPAKGLIKCFFWSVSSVMKLHSLPSFPSLTLERELINLTSIQVLLHGVYRALDAGFRMTIKRDGKKNFLLNSSYMNLFLNQDVSSFRYLNSVFLQVDII